VRITKDAASTGVSTGARSETPTRWAGQESGRRSGRNIDHLLPAWEPVSRFSARWWSVQIRFRSTAV